MDYSHVSPPGGSAAAFYRHTVQQMAASGSVFPGPQPVSPTPGGPLIPPSLGLYQGARSGRDEETAQTSGIPAEMMAAFGFGNIGMTLPVVTESRSEDQVHSALPRPPPLKRAPATKLHTSPDDSSRKKSSQANSTNNNIPEKSLPPVLSNSQGKRVSPVSVTPVAHSPSSPLSGTGGGAQKFACTKCSYSTNRKFKLMQHMAAHSGRWICHVCNKAFIKSADLDRHIPIHSKSSLASRVNTTTATKNSDHSLTAYKLNDSGLASKSEFSNLSASDCSDESNSVSGSPRVKRLYEDDDDEDFLKKKRLCQEPISEDQNSQDNGSVNFPRTQNPGTVSDMPVFPGFDVGYPQAEVIRETTSTSDDMQPLAPPELPPQIGDPSANISPRKNSSYMRYRNKRGHIKPRDPTLPIRKPRNFKICTKCNRIKPFTNWDRHELCPRCRTCSRAQSCNICLGFSENEWELIEERMARYATRTGPHIPSVRSVFIQCRYCSYGTRDRIQLQKHYKAHGEAKKICKYCGKAFERPFDLSRHEARHEARLARTGQLSLKDVSRKSKSPGNSTSTTPSKQLEATTSSSTEQKGESPPLTSSLDQMATSAVQAMGYPSVEQVTAQSMLPLPLPLLSPEGLIVPNTMSLDSEGRLVSPLLSALQHLPLAALPALTSASLLGALANQQLAAGSSETEQSKTTDNKEETEPFLTASMRRQKEVKRRIRSFIASQKFYSCDVCGAKYGTKISLRIHWRHCHRRTAARLDTFSHSVLTETRVITCQVNRESRQISVEYVMPDLAEVIRRGNRVPHVSDINVIKRILTRSEHTTATTDGEHDLFQTRTLSTLDTSQCQSPGNIAPAPSADPTQSSSSMLKSSSPNMDNSTLTSLSSLLQANRVSANHSTPDVATLMALSAIMQASSGSGAGGVNAASLLPWLTGLTQPQPSSVEPKETTSPGDEGLNRTDLLSSSPELGAVLPASLSLTGPQSGRKLSGDICCTQCNYSTNSQTKYEEHLKAHRGRFICKLCSKAFIKITDLTRHWMGHQMKGEYLQCDTCTFKTDNRDVLDEHLRSHYRVNARPELMLRTLRHIPGAKLFLHGKRLSMRKAVWRLEQRRRLEKEPGDVSDSPSEDEDGCLLDPVDQTYYNEAEDKEEILTDPYVCVECGGEFATGAELEYHRRKDHPPTHHLESHHHPSAQRHTVKEDHPPVQRYVVREDSTSEEEDDFPFSCDHCGKGFYDEDKMTRHMKIKHGKRRRSGSPRRSGSRSPRRRSESPRARGAGSPRRGSGRPSIDSLTQEPLPLGSKQILKTPSPRAVVVPVELEVSPKPTGGHSSPNKQYRCEFCNKRFTTHAYLVMHRRLHTGEQPFTCHRCGAAYAMKQQLLAHHGRNCEPPNKPRTRYYSTSPINIPDSATYNCPYCQEGFSDSQVLDQHVMAKHNKPECHLCGKTYSNLFYLKDHLRLHSGQMPYKCLCCGRKYAMKGSLLGHLRINRRCKQKHYQIARAGNKVNPRPTGENITTECSDIKETAVATGTNRTPEFTAIKAALGKTTQHNVALVVKTEETVSANQVTSDKGLMKESVDSDDTIVDDECESSNLTAQGDEPTTGADVTIATSRSAVPMETGAVAGGSKVGEVVKRKRRKPVKFIPDEDTAPSKHKVSKVSPEFLGVSGMGPMGPPGGEGGCYSDTQPATPGVNKENSANAGVDHLSTSIGITASVNRADRGSGSVIQASKPAMFTRKERGRACGRVGLGLASKIRELTEKNLAGVVKVDDTMNSSNVLPNIHPVSSSSRDDKTDIGDETVIAKTRETEMHEKKVDLVVCEPDTTSTEVVIDTPADTSLVELPLVCSPGRGSGVSPRGRGRGRRRGRGRGHQGTPRVIGATRLADRNGSPEEKESIEDVINKCESTSHENGAKGVNKNKCMDEETKETAGDISQGNTPGNMTVDGIVPGRAASRATRSVSRQSEGQMALLSPPRRSLRRSSSEAAPIPRLTLQQPDPILMGTAVKSRRGRKKKASPQKTVVAEIKEETGQSVNNEAGVVDK